MTRLGASCTLISIGVVLFHAADAGGDTRLSLDVPRVKEAIVQQIRFQMYWWGREDQYRQGETLPLHIASDGRRFIAMAEDFELLPDGRHVVAIFKGEQGKERTRIWQSSGTPHAPGDTLEGEWWVKFDPDLKNPNVVHDTLTVPANEVPQIAPDSPEKIRMRDLVVNSVKEQLSWNVVHRREELPPSVTLVVGDFNVEDPNAFVLVEEQQRVYEVYLFDPAEPTNPKYREGPFLVLPIEGRPTDDAFLRTRVRGLGRLRQVTLSLDSSEPSPGRTP